MGYMHINNLYKYQDILVFKWLYALEKIHGTSANIRYKDGIIQYHSGGESYQRFVGLFNEPELLAKFQTLPMEMEVVIYGEAYGGKQQGMSGTYGKELKFVAFDVTVDDKWLTVPKAEKFVTDLGLRFVYYTVVNTDNNLEQIEAQKNAPSVEAERNGMGADKLREGIVLRPPFECFDDHNNRMIIKHKRDEFRETASPRVVKTSEELEKIAEVNRIADEWVTEMRLTHILDKLGEIGMEDIPKLIKAMNEDIAREGEGEFVPSKEAERAIGKATVALFKNRLRKTLVNTAGE